MTSRPQNDAGNEKESGATVSSEDWACEWHSEFFDRKVQNFLEKWSQRLELEGEPTEEDRIIYLAFPIRGFEIVRNLRFSAYNHFADNGAEFGELFGRYPEFASGLLNLLLKVATQNEQENARKLNESKRNQGVDDLLRSGGLETEHPLPMQRSTWADVIPDANKVHKGGEKTGSDYSKLAYKDREKRKRIVKSWLHNFRAYQIATKRGILWRI